MLSRTTYDPRCCIGDVRPDHNFEFLRMRKLCRAVLCTCAMRSSAAAVLLLCVVTASLVLSVYGGEKLRIGVKKRVENCEIRSKKGDRLSMHYTVSSQFQ